MSNNNRPEWAQGPEWDGWERYCTDHVRRRVIADAWLFAYNLGPNHFSLSGDSVNITFRNLSTMRHIANLIAEDRGGWA